MKVRQGSHVACLRWLGHVCERLLLGLLCVYLDPSPRLHRSALPFRGVARLGWARRSYKLDGPADAWRPRESRRTDMQGLRDAGPQRSAEVYGATGGQRHGGDGLGGLTSWMERLKRGDRMTSHSSERTSDCDRWVMVGSARRAVHGGAMVVSVRWGSSRQCMAGPW